MCHFQKTSCNAPTPRRRYLVKLVFGAFFLLFPSSSSAWNRNKYVVWNTRKDQKKKRLGTVLCNLLWNVPDANFVELKLTVWVSGWEGGECASFSLPLPNAHILSRTKNSQLLLTAQRNYSYSYRHNKSNSTNPHLWPTWDELCNCWRELCVNVQTAIAVFVIFLTRSSPLPLHFPVSLCSLPLYPYTCTHNNKNE